MNLELSDKIIGYHYSNPTAYESMRDGRERGKDGLIPTHKFVSLGDGNGPLYEAYDSVVGLPDEAYANVVEGLLEPEPKSWLENPEFPHLWNSLMYDVCKTDEVILLSFQLEPQDRAYIVDIAHLEREMYREVKGQGKPTRESITEAFRKYWKSRVPVFKYDGSYSLPLLAIWASIGFDRLKVEWVKSSGEVLKGVYQNDILQAENFKKTFGISL